MGVVEAVVVALLSAIMLFVAICAYCLAAAITRNSAEQDPDTLFLRKALPYLRFFLKCLLGIISVSYVIWGTYLVLMSAVLVSG